MQDKQVKTKETDITPYIVATFVVMVAILIAKMAGDFTTMQTSSATKAAPPKANSKQKAVYKKGEAVTTVQAGKTLSEFCMEKGKLNTSNTSTVYVPAAGDVRAVQYWWNGCATDNGEVSLWSGWTTYATTVYPQYLNCCIKVNALEKRSTAYCNSFSTLYDASGVALTGDSKPEGKCLEQCNDVYTRKMKNVLSPDLEVGYTPGCDLAKMKYGLYEKISGVCCFK